LEPQALNLGAMLTTKARDARFRNGHAMLGEQILNLRESGILGSQHEHRCAMSFQLSSSLGRNDKIACGGFQRVHVPQITRGGW
jgi:hypothetical protein